MAKTNFVDIILQKSNSQPDKIILKDRWKNWTWHNLLSSSFGYTELIRKNFQHQNISAILLFISMPKLVNELEQFDPEVI